MTTRRTTESFGIVVGQRLKAARLEARVTQEQLSDKTGVSRPHISRYEHGRAVPALYTVVVLCDALGVPLSRLVSEYDAPHLKREVVDA